jgi:dienelactone hydrolase
MSRCMVAALLLLCLLSARTEEFTAQQAPAPDPFVLTEALALPGVGYAGRSPVYSSPLVAGIVDGTFTAPKAGDKVTRTDGTQVEWRAVKAGDDGWISEREMAYLFWTVESDKEQVAILKARGHSSVYVNGESRAGDPYNYGYVELPVLLKKGTNQFLFNTGRGRVKANLQGWTHKTPYLNGRDATVPDLVVGRTVGKHIGSIVAVNPLTEPVWASTSFMRPDGVHVRDGSHIIPALSARKIPFRIVIDKELEKGEYEVPVHFTARTLSTPENEALGGVFHTLQYTVVEPHEPRRVTFVSRIDGSVQYYAVRPARPLPDAEEKPGIVLSLHGASVEASGQAGAYSSKSWCHIVCPTNRRPFGFDWEDWGRLDALEVLAHAQSTLDYDPTKVWLTGHSMGGHGTWTVGSHFPDKFAAIGPSAGWEDFWSYGGGASHPEDLAVSEILTRAANPCRTLLRKHNHSQQGVYILHGDADDNVPVTQARRMRDVLKEFHTDLGYYEEPGAGHWWDRGHDDGADCLDWRPMFDMFSRRRLPRINEVQHVDFTTVCPGHSADCHWACIEMQNKQFAPSRVRIELFPNRGVFEGTTENVTRLSFQVDGVISSRESVAIKLDGSELEAAWPEDGRIYLRKSDGAWKVGERAEAALKGPHRYGWFKNAFNHGFVYVYGTQGSPEETAAYIAKCRYDQETWWYRGNGGFDVVADKDFDPAGNPGCNVILIGNADTNSAWDKLLKDCPLRVAKGKAVIGERVVEGDDLAMLFVYPRAGTDNHSVGVIGSTGLKGTKLTDRLGYFVSGASFPDVILYSPEMLQSGTAGVLAAGFLGEDWSVDRGEIAWRAEKKSEEK